MTAYNNNFEKRSYLIVKDYTVFELFPLIGL